MPLVQISLVAVTLVSGLALTGWGLVYLRRGWRFASRHGGTSSPWRIIACGALLLALAFFTATGDF